MFRIKYSREIALKVLYELDALKYDAAQAGPVIYANNPEADQYDLDGDGSTTDLRGRTDNIAITVNVVQRDTQSTRKI